MTLLTMQDSIVKKLARELITHINDNFDLEIERVCDDVQMEVSENGLEITIEFKGVEHSDGFYQRTFHIKHDITGSEEWIEFGDDYPTHSDYQGLREG